MQIVSFLTPTNLASEEQKFFSSNSYNPQLTYDWESPAAQKFMASDKYSTLTDALLHKNYNAAVHEAKQLFQTDIEQVVLSTATKILASPPVIESQPSVQNIISTFERAFAQLGLGEYTVEVTDQLGFNFRPNQSRKSLVMSSHAEFGYLTLVGEVKHELAHIIRYQNGLHNGIEYSKNYLPTEEGLAVFCQDYTDGGRPESQFQHAAEYAVTEVMLAGSFRAGYTYLRELGFSKNLAWQRAIRHKFGWQDTSQPGDIMKPSMYFYHAQKMRALQAVDRYRLFVGKIALDELAQYPEYSGRIPLEFLENFYQFSE